MLLECSKMREEVCNGNGGEQRRACFSAIPPRGQTALRVGINDGNRTRTEPCCFDGEVCGKGGFLPRALPSNAARRRAACRDRGPQLLHSRGALPQAVRAKGGRRQGRAAVRAG